MLDHRERLEWRVEATKGLPSTAPRDWDESARRAALHGHLPWMYTARAAAAASGMKLRPRASPAPR